MAGSNLSSGAIRELIIRYEMELSKLEFQQENTRKTIDSLKKDLKNSLNRETRDRKARLQDSESTAAEPAPAPKASKQKAKPASAKDNGEQAAEAKPATTIKSATTRKRTRKATTTKSSSKPAPRKRAKPTASTKQKPKGRDKGYRLSEIDQIIFEALDSKGKVLITNELQDYAEEKIRESGKPVDSDDVRLKISRSLQKLANRRHDLVKVPFEGRGFAYAIPRWLNKDGEVKAKFNRK